MTHILIISAAVIIFVAILVYIILYYRRKISAFSEELSHTLDDMIAENNPDFEIISDTVDGKINVRLKRLYEILNSRTEQSKRDKEKIQELVSDISHQVKTPAANLKMYMQILLRQDIDEEKRREFVELSLAQTEKLEFLMQALIKMSRLETGIISFKKEKLSVAEIIGESLVQIISTAENKNISVQVNCPDSIYAFCDIKWTAEAVFNILDNAVKYTPENGCITVSADTNEFYAQIKIRDNGAGIPESEQAKIFGRFYRSEAVKDTEGLGIGLFLSRNIISEQGGFIIVKSEPPDGAEFIVSMPIE
ncbi:MAG: HAMP domain-containing histidine kinase [Lachnospiraceae bacterium]|nr:HAMP domain-containing histidine kinase [Lachnospiraceae bacterium]